MHRPSIALLLVATLVLIAAPLATAQAQSYDCTQLGAFTDCSSSNGGNSSCTRLGTFTDCTVHPPRQPLYVAPPQEPAYLPEGSFVKVVDAPAIYVVSYQSLHAFATWQVFLAWGGHADLSNVRTFAWLAPSLIGAPLGQ